MEAFEGAVRLGYRVLETDLHITSDGVLVCIHDDRVDRTTEGVGAVSDYTFAELSKLDAGFRHRGPEGHGFRGLGLAIPAFEELVTSFPETRLIVDLKVGGMARTLAEVVERHDLAGRMIVGSFSEQRLGEFTVATHGRVPTSTGPRTIRKWLVTSRVGRRPGGSASALQVPVQIRGLQVVDRRLVVAAHAHGLQVHVWTVNDLAEMETLLDLGVDGIVTDRLEMLRDVLLTRGQWIVG